LSAQRPGQPRPQRFPAAATALALALAAALWAAASSPAQQSTAGGSAGSNPPPPKSKQAAGTQGQGSSSSQPSQSSQGSSAGAKQGQGGASAGSGGSTTGNGGAAGAGTLGAPPPDMGSIDQILEGDEEVLSGNNGFTYDPGNRRDPFKSLLIAPDRPEFRGPRPEGIPGLLIDEVDLKGILRTARGYIAQVSASNQKKMYLLKEGDQLYDGDVVSIGKNEVVFKQIVQDPTALKPFREIVKSFTPQ
jgi:hypothetical protein